MSYSLLTGYYFELEANHLRWFGTRARHSSNFRLETGHLRWFGTQARPTFKQLARVRVLQRRIYTKLRLDNIAFRGRLIWRTPQLEDAALGGTPQRRTPQPLSIRLSINYFRSDLKPHIQSASITTLSNELEAVSINEKTGRELSNKGHLFNTSKSTGNSAEKTENNEILLNAINAETS